MADIVGRESGKSGRYIQRYTRPTELIPELLDIVDGKRMAFNPSVELSYWQKSEETKCWIVLRNMR